jgi:ubiquinone/menaquinone biosynthesis C-methylase UbiE
VDEPLPLDFTSAHDVALYDELPLWSSLAGQLLLEHVTLAGVRRALDVGCGTGFPLLELAERLGRRAWSAGLDPLAVPIARTRGKIARWSPRNASAIRGDGAAMPFRSGAFDLVVSNLGVNNFDDPAAALRECHRVLAPGGRLGLSSNLVGHMREFYDAFEGVLAAEGNADGLERLRRAVMRRATVPGLRAQLESAGFRVALVREREAVMRFASSDALFSHHFIRMGFRPGWEEIAGPEALVRVGEALDRAAGGHGIALTIPLAYVEAVRV